jgi:hypothetical protein
MDQLARLPFPIAGPSLPCCSLVARGDRRCLSRGPVVGAHTILICESGFGESGLRCGPVGEVACGCGECRISHNSPKLFCWHTGIVLADDCVLRMRPGTGKVGRVELAFAKKIGYVEQGEGS